MLEAQEVSVHFGKSPILREVSLSLVQGETVALLGATGSGKSTLLRVLMGLQPIRTGKILWNGVPANMAELARQGKLAWVPQHEGFYPQCTVEENLRLAQQFQSTSTRRIEPWREVLARDIPDLLPMLRRRPDELSGGQQRLLALARALVKSPEFLLLDEPFSPLDPPLRQTMRERVWRLQKDRRIGVLHVTHDPMEAQMVADRVVFLDQGRVLQQGAPESLREDPQHLEVAKWMRRMSSLFFSLPPSAEPGCWDLPEWNLSLRIDSSQTTLSVAKPLDLIVPSEAWTPLRGEAPEEAARASVSISMKPMERRWIDSHRWRRWATPGGQSCWRIEQQEGGYGNGESVACSMDWNRLLWFQPSGDRMRCEVVASWPAGRAASS
jgi:ABC-type sugar transport system ATPase subunit